MVCTSKKGKKCTNAAHPISDLNLCIISSGHVLLLDHLDKSLCLFRLDNVPYFSFIIKMLKQCGRISFAMDFRIGYTDFKQIHLLFITECKHCQFMDQLVVFYLFIHAESCQLFHKNMYKLHEIWKKMVCTSKRVKTAPMLPAPSRY